MTTPYEDLKTFAAKRCLDIYNDFDETEIIKQSKSIVLAWEAGRDLDAHNKAVELDGATRCLFCETGYVRPGYHCAVPMRK
ncbi:MAG: hypothetical protein SWH61_03365 [Thermodesulfobacteriota bacterium]|nr:hypothetical protein [Thermodesulfobacteriota bacterium]